MLTHPAYQSLHPDKLFNELVKKYAKQEKITLASEDEPGTRIAVQGSIVDKNNKPLNNALVYVYQTDNRGLYSNQKGNGDNRNPQLFGYFKTMDDGSFQFETIRPRGYPGANIPRHIHLEVFNGGDALLVTELLFDDDERLTASMRKQMVNEGYYVAGNAGTVVNPLYRYNIKTGK